MERIEILEAEGRMHRAWQDVKDGVCPSCGRAVPRGIKEHVNKWSPDCFDKVADALWLSIEQRAQLADAYIAQPIEP